jgi:8-oxo-dGTP pyrophosphatase MutT (NUDIX family)
MFQAWHNALKEAGNRLDEARVLWTFRVPKKGVLSYVLHVKVWIAAEGRWKENEWVFARTDVASVVMYRWPGERNETFPAMRGLTELRETEVVLVKEFRSTARTPDGFIHEVPGGSCESADDSAKESAAREVYEETGIVIAKDRLRYVGSRQAVGVLSTHKVHGFAVELTEAEMKQAKTLAAAEETHGEEQDSEKTYVEVTTVQNLLQGEETDWTTLGLIFRSIR